MLPALPSHQNSATHATKPHTLGIHQNRHHLHHHVLHHSHLEGVVSSGNSNSGSGSSINAVSTPTKRNSSMIFRIEHLLPLATTAPTAAIAPTTTTTTTPPPSNLLSTATSTTSIAHIQQPQTTMPPTNGTRRSNSKTNAARAAGVYLKQFAPKDTASDLIGTLALMSTGSTVSLTQTSSNDSVHQQQKQQMQQQQQQSHHHHRTYCAIMQGMLRLTASAMRRIKLSEDIHSYNALFELVNNTEVRLRIVRDIGRDEELIAWFDEELTMLMAIPFLTPLNIQGNNRYTCHICQLSFETPNPLKIHLALSCGRHTLDILWIRLHYALKSTHFQQQRQQQQHHHQLLPMPLLHHELPSISTAAAVTLQRSTQITCSSSATLPTFSPLISNSANLQQQQQQRFSAFKPMSPSSSAAISLMSSPSSSLTSTAPTITTATTSSISSLSLPLTTHSGSNTTTQQQIHSHQFTFLPSLSTTTPMSLLQTSSCSPLNSAAQIEAIVSNMGASKQGHLCIYCGKVYSRKYGLKIHIRTHTGFKPLKCKFCLRPFGDPSNLNKHVRLHLQASGSVGGSGSGGGCGCGSSGSNNATAAGHSINATVDGYKCHLCHKTLARRRDLQRHIESRHNDGS